MAVNVGQVPADLQAPIGQFRLLANDLASSPLNPDVAGRGQYELFSDNEISGFLSMYPTSVLRAVATAYLTLAGRASVESAITKDYDLQVDLTKKATDLRATANVYFARADAENALLGTDSAFDLSGGEADTPLGPPYDFPLYPFRPDLDPTLADVSFGANGTGFGAGGYGQ